MHLSTVLEPAGHYCGHLNGTVGYKIIRNKDLLFHISDTPLHLLKVITCLKQWKGELKCKIIINSNN